jgi:hypothetical protein
LASSASARLRSAIRQRISSVGRVDIEAVSLRVHRIQVRRDFGSAEWVKSELKKDNDVTNHCCIS